MDKLTKEEKAVIIWTMGGHIDTKYLTTLFYPNKATRTLQPHRHIELSIIKKLQGETNG